MDFLFLFFKQSVFTLYYDFGHFLFNLVYTDLKNLTVNTSLSSLKLRCFIDNKDL